MTPLNGGIVYIKTPYPLGCELEGYTVQKKPPATLLQDIRKPMQLHNQSSGARLSHEKQGELVSQATPFVERGRARSRCNHRVVATTET